MPKTPTSRDIAGDEQPPLLKGWNHWYVLVIVILLLQILLFNLFTRIFS